MSNNDNKRERPRFLTLWQITLPLTGLVSILHRVSGLFLFLMLPLSLYLLELSLSGTDGYQQAGYIMKSWPARVIAGLLLWLFAHHLFAGLRVLLIDMEWGSGLIMARRTSIVVLLAALLVAVGGLLL